MIDNIAIQVTDLKKSFRIYMDKGNTLKEKILFKNRRKFEKRQVLNGINLQIKKGEAIGLIGENGCGKSTLLKLLTKIMYPDSGTIKVNGRVSSLIELGAGFHPDMSGRENIYINASIFGLTKKEIEKKMKDIIEFSELEAFVDNPLRTYSSGMYMRLAFAVAINVNADILMIDEILAVGDASFQAKCFNKLQEIKEKGTTIIIVSHSLGQIEQICERSIWIHDGKIEIEGAPKFVHAEYRNFMDKKMIKNTNDSKNEKNINNKYIKINNKEDEIKKDYSANGKKKRWGNGDVMIKSVNLYDAQGKERYTFNIGEKIKIRVEYQYHQPVKNPSCGIAINTLRGDCCYGTNTFIDKVDFEDIIKDGYYECIIEECELMSGKYSIDVAISNGNDFDCDYIIDAKQFQIVSTAKDIGMVYLKHNWYLNELTTSTSGE